MTSLKEHQAAMVALLASGTGIPASASRLAHAMHDVLAQLNNTATSPVAHTERRIEATTSGLNDAALAWDIEQAIRPSHKPTGASVRIKQLENTVLQLNDCVVYLVADNANLEAQLNAVIALQKEPEQAGCRKPETKVPEEDWFKWSGGRCPVPLDTVVEATFKDGNGDVLEAKYLMWEHEDNGGDVVAYRVVKS